MKVVIGYGARGPVVVTRPEEAERLVWNNQLLQQSHRVFEAERDQGAGQSGGHRKAVRREIAGGTGKGIPVRAQRRACDRHGVRRRGPAQMRALHRAHAAFRGRDPRRGGRARSRKPALSPNRFAALMAMPPAERMAFWAEEFNRCVKCYACRQVCPMCYCERCIVDKNRPIAIDPAPSTKGNFAWQIARAFHLAGRCVGCGECSRACPAGIDIALLNISLHIAAQKNFGYEAGADPKAEP